MTAQILLWQGLSRPKGRIYDVQLITVHYPGMARMAMARLPLRLCRAALPAH